MAKTDVKKSIVEREYTIPLRREYLKVKRHKRTPKTVKAVKQFIARHMKVENRDLKKVKIDKWLNNELWFRGIKNPPNKIKVKAVKEGDIVKVSLVNIPEKVKYAIERENKDKKEQEKKKPAVKEKSEEKEAEKDEKEVKEEKEKEASVMASKELQAEMQAKEQKHTSKQKPAKTERIQIKTLPKK
ncbi:50S ribosomal protein L31e [Candidatus Pacearchaeota archaeon]|nr:50S ribosomal protein L31e [Candidatus Pacearchaeota archaeon]